MSQLIVITLGGSLLFMVFVIGVLDGLSTAIPGRKARQDD